MQKQKPDYNTLFQFNPLPNWVYDRNTYEILDVNQSAIEHYGYTKAEFLSLTIIDLRPKPDIPRVLAAHADIDQRVGNIYFGVFTHQKKNGALIRMDINGHKVDFQGRACVMVVCQDVTEKERQVQELLDSEKKLKAASAIAKLGYWRLEKDEHTLSWSDEVYDIWGLNKTHSKLNFKSFLQTIHPDDRQAFLQAKANAFSYEKVFDFSHRIILPGNVTRWVHHLGRKLKDANGDIIAYEGTVQDITVHKENQQQLKLLESVVTNTTDAVIITDAGTRSDPTKRIIYVNEAFTKMTGYSAQEAIGKSPKMLQGPDSDKDEIDKLGKELQRVEACESILLNYDKYGEEYWVNLAISPITQEDGKITHYIAVERDITGQKNRELENILISQISLIFNDGKNLSVTTSKMCSLFADFGNFDFVEIWLPNKANNQIGLIDCRKKTKIGDLFYQVSHGINSFKMDEDLPGLVWRERKAVFWDELQSMETFPRKLAATCAGVKSFMGFPFLYNDQVVGILVIGSAKPMDKLSRFKSIFRKLEGIVGSEYSRKNLESDLSHLFDALPDIMCLTDTTGRILRINPAGCKLLGYREREILLKSFHEHVHPEDLSLTLNMLSKLCTNDSVIQFENRCITKKEEILWLGWTCNTGIEEGIIYATAKNITKEKKLGKLNDQASSLAKIGSWELDLVNKGDNEMYWSPMTRKIFEVDDSYNPTLTGGFEFYSEESKIRIQQAVKKLVKDRIDFDEDLLLITSTGKERWVRCIGTGESIQGKSVKVFGSFQDIHTSKILEIQIREILGSISDAFYAMDKYWNFTFFNKEAENLLKRNESELLGKSIWEEFPAAIGTPLEEIFRRVASSGTPESFEYFFPGDGKWYEINTYPFDGGVSSYFRNIDGRRKTAEKLRKASEEKTMILESIGDAFFTVNKEFEVTYWNKKAEELVYVPREEIVGKNFWDVIPYAKKLISFTMFYKALKSGEMVAFEDVYRDKFLEVTAYPSETGLTIFLRDISERKRSEQEILAANERFEKVSEATNDAIWDWDIENKSFFRGKGIEKFFGDQVRRQIEEKDFWTDNFDPAILDALKKSIYAAISNPKQSRWEMEYRIIKKNDQDVHVVDRGIIIRDMAGKAVRMVGAMTDISERKQHENKLKELNQTLQNYAHELEITNEQLEQFAFIASHDLQEPLRMISSFLEQLRRKYGNLLDEKGLQYIHFATDGAKRMKQIILDLLEYSRAGKAESDIETVNLNQLLEDYLLLRRKVIKEKEATITSGPLPIIPALKAPLTQTLHCILDNAIKYSKESEAPKIKIKMEDTGDYWCISIEDNGIGIDSQFFEKIFIIFQRLHNRSQYSGTGIGLAIAKKHVESWGGKIWMKSQPGVGSVFYFTIPNNLKHSNN
ncbi:MAG TPA: PAS domain S-box protein [Lunatimonas sp.]|nr:PAS domain S-box protein [Lunatimonas sp.]